MAVRSIIVWTEVPEDFRAAYEAEHVPLIRAVPGLASFAVSPLRSRTGGVVAELTFADAAAMREGYSSPDGERLVAHANELEQRFAATVHRFVTEDPIASGAE